MKFLEHYLVLFFPVLNSLHCYTYFVNHRFYIIILFLHFVIIAPLFLVICDKYELYCYHLFPPSSIGSQINFQKM